MSTRSAGILLHPTSLPGHPGIGDLGRDADRFLEWAAAAGQRVWQVLPIGPVAPGNSPYAALSSFAGNPMLISPEILVEDGLLPRSAPDERPDFPENRVDFRGVARWKRGVLRASWNHFRANASGDQRRELEAFLEDPAQRVWIDDWSLYSALRDRLDGRSWTRWPGELRRREPSALMRARRDMEDSIACSRYEQFLFFRQWTRVKEEARRMGIRILGDLPIYVALDSADTWANPGFFTLDPEGRPESVAGVPPDYFSATGQRWGNPLYRWDRLEESGYDWWIARVRANLRLADVLRLDHFRGFVAYWEIPASEKTAVRGRWVEGPGERLFEALRKALGDLPFVAEDLGTITPDVRELRGRLGLPGMKVLQFAFDEPGSEHLPARHESSCVVYTGTHDNDTTRGWFGKLDGNLKSRVLDYFGSDGGRIEWDMIRAAYGSVADLAVVPLQDVLGLGSEGRMNVPGRARGNWTWRASRGHLGDEPASRLRREAEESGRAP